MCLVRKVGERMKIINRFLKEEKGAALVLVAISMTAFLGFAAIVIDVGRFYLEKERLNNAIDAAALASSQELLINPDNAVEIGLQYAELNGVDRNNVELTVVANGVDIKASKIAETYFAKVLGFEKQNIGVSAKARAGTVSSLLGIVPFGIEEQELTFGVEYRMKTGGGQGEHGWYGPLRLGGNGATVYRDNFKYGYESVIRVGDIVDVESGNMSGPTKDGVEYRINNCPHYPKCTVEHYEKDCAKLVYVPIVRDLGGHGSNRTVEIVGFAAMILSDVTGNGNDSEVHAYFVRMITQGEFDLNGNDYGVKAIKLIE